MIDMKKVTFIVVVYHVTPRESTTLISLSCLDFDRYGVAPTFAVWDNSVEGYGLDRLPNFSGDVKYYHTGKNQGLAEVYNSVVKDCSGSEWFVFLDDDSVVDTDYLCNLERFFSTEILLAVPRIVSQGRLISPGLVKGVKGKSWKLKDCTAGARRSSSIVAMMSGTVVNAKVFAMGVSFDERLTFYGVDTRFFIDYSRKFSQLYILDVVMPHHSALRDRSLPMAVQMDRQRRLVSAWPIIFDYVPFFRLRVFFRIVYYSIKLSACRRDFRFLSLLTLAVRVSKDKS